MYKIEVMPFGLMDAPALFDRMMDEVLHGLTFDIVYLNEVLLYLETLGEHIRHCRQVFERIREA